MKKKLNPWFYVPFIIFLAAGGFLLTQINKGQVVLFVNGCHSVFLDYLFYYGTSLGNGLLYIVMALILAWFSFRYSFLALICFSATGILVQLLKKLVFSEITRPSVLLADEPLHFVEGVKILHHYSFPSGHTAVAFSLFCFLSHYFKPSWLGMVFLVMALIGGISRIYLVQHFFVDVYFGALLGVVVTTLIWKYYHRSSVFNSSAFLNRSLSAYFRS